MEGYAPPLPLGFGWSSEEEEDNNLSFAQLKPNKSKNVLSSELMNSCSNDKTKSLRNNILQIEELVEKNRRADQDNLINFDQSGTVIAIEEMNNTCVSNPFELNQKYLRLPVQSIAYDFTCLPLRAVEQERKFLPLIGELSAPFLRPIIIDGIGLIKAYWEGCSDDDEDGSNGATSYLCAGDRSFPIVPIIRCLFYWVSRGHFTRLCFPIGFNPIVNRQEYGVSDQHLRSLKQLETYGMALFFESSPDSAFPNQQWFTDKRDLLRGCLVTSMSHYIEGMPSSLQQTFNYKTWAQTHMSSEHTLQPYFGPRGDLVFFSPIKEGKKEFVTDIVLDNDIKTEVEFKQFECFQLRFISQAKNLKVLYELLPKEKRAQEAHVMCALLKRLKWHLSI